MTSPPAAAEPELRAENERLRGAILWALGYGDFSERQPGQGAYWWRIELAQRAAIQPLYAAAPPPIALPREPTKEMLEAMLRALTDAGGWVNNDSLAATWSAGYDAAVKP